MLATAPAPAPRTPAYGLALLEEAVDACLASSEEPLPAGPSRDRDEAAEQLRRTRVLINRLELFFARRASRWTNACETDLDFEGNPAGQIREECRMTSHAAVTALQVGAYEHQLPKSIDAFVDGRIGLAHLGLLAETAEFAGRLPGPPAFAEGHLLHKAERLNVSRFRKECYHARHAMDAAACVADAADEVDFRRLRLRPGEAGGLFLSGFFDPEGGALIRTALEPLARPSGPEEYRGRDQRLADALVELAAHRLDHGEVPARASQRSHLQVTTTLETLRGLAAAPGAELEYGGEIPDATVQRLACDATITRVLLSAESAVIDVGRSQRVVPGSTRRALNVRDRGCRWPGCTRSASWTAAHHIVHWVHGGRTDLSNLVLLCHRHHWLVHECGFQIVRTDDGEILTLPPHPDHGSRARPPTPLAA
jgi:Domain of unknown function (DUF222)/HNH endonuclease